MPDITYSVIGVLALIIHQIINRDNLRRIKNGDASESLRSYRRFLLAIMFYYITDSLWGIFDGLNLTKALMADTYFYYAAMASAVYFWSSYVVSYLKDTGLPGRIIKTSGLVFVAFEITALFVNIVKPVFFWFDNEGNYHAGSIRYVALYIQIAMFMLSSIQVFAVSLRSEGTQKRRNQAIALFGVTMMAAIAAQIDYPLLPIYSIGYMIGECFLHVHVEEDEKEENFCNLSRNMTIVSSMAGIYFCSYYVDLKAGTFAEVENRIYENNSFIGRNGNAAETLEKMCEHLVMPQYAKEMREFVNLDTINERLTEKKYYISMQFESVHLGWAEGYFIAADRDENGKLLHVIWAIRTINDEKEKEEKLLYNSYIDELTGLYNRKMYAEDIAENHSLTDGEDFVYVSMDVNGLKTVNDGLGHAAGDELIRGAAECMKKCMGSFGRVYRTGGDEFIALLKVESGKLESLKKDFSDTTAEFKGKYISGVSVSCGYVARRDNTELTFDEIEKLADKNMYTAKRIHYTSNGIDRRAQQQNAYKALCTAYTKILKINLNENKYTIISMNTDEQSQDKGFSEGIFEWLEMFAKSGQVHPDDMEHYLSNTDRKFLCSYFTTGKEHLNVSYRRKIGDGFSPAEMKMIPADDFTPDSQNLFLYVENLHGNS
ncbi:MAG: GGDEF domain-containing protein [Oscillospiraceae bacterium]|nr:GGDEF domain-containing protein [Oscillospiraceae bacterium]